MMPRAPLLLSLLLGAFLLLCLPLLLNRSPTNYTWDEQNYYLPAIRQIREHWPGLDLTRDSLSATAPGFPYLLAGLSLLTGPGVGPMRWATFLSGAAVLVALWFFWNRDGKNSVLLGLAALLPLAASNFVVKASSHVVTDMAALLSITLLLGLAFSAPSGRVTAASGVLGALAVALRQNSLWVLAPVCLPLLQRRNLPGAALAAVPALLVLCAMVGAWGGLVPPAWQSMDLSSFTPAALTYALAVLGMLGGFYFAAAAGPELGQRLRDRWWIAGAAVGLLVAVAGETTMAPDAGRWGGYFWNLSTWLPAWGGRSLLFLLLAPFGGAVLAGMIRLLWQRTGTAATLVWLAGVLAFLASIMLNRQVFHRYYEPTLLVLLVFWLQLVTGPRPASSRPDQRPLFVLAVLQVLITALTAYRHTFSPS